MAAKDDPNRLRQRAAHYERIADRMIDDQVVKALRELAEYDRQHADTLADRSAGSR